MPGADVLLTIAQISVAFAGFSGLIGVATGSPDEVSSSYWFRLWVMIEFSMATMMLAVLPFVGHYFELPPERLWALCSASIVAFLIGHLVVATPRVIDLRRSGRWSSPPAILDHSVPVLIVALLAVGSSNALGVGLGRSFAGFLLGLVLLLAISCVNFVCLMWSRLVPRLDPS